MLVLRTLSVCIRTASRYEARPEAMPVFILCLLTKLFLQVCEEGAYVVEVLAGIQLLLRDSPGAFHVDACTTLWLSESDAREFEHQARVR